MEKNVEKNKNKMENNVENKNDMDKNNNYGEITRTTLG